MRTFRSHTALLAVVVMLLLAACGPGGEGSAGAPASVAAPASGTAASAAASAEAEIDTTPVVIAWQSTPDENYLPILMALDAMREQGYDINAQQMSDSNLVLQGMSSGAVHFTADSLQAGAQGREAGVPIKAITTRNANQVVYVANSDYEDCAGLDGQPSGVYSPDAAYTILMNLYFEANCPGISTEYVIIQDSPLRAQAMTQGQIFATTLGLPDAMALEAQAPGEFFMASLATELPGVGDEYLYASESTIADHPNIVDAFVREHLVAIRSLYEDPSSATALVEQYFPETDGDAVAQRFIEDQLWYANGGLKGPGLEATLEAFDLPGSREDLVDDTGLRAALDEIGDSDQTEY